VPAPCSRGPDPLGWGEISLLTSIPAAIAVGLILGFLAGLGVGGGSLLILWLTLLLDTEANTARAINLMFFITAAGSVSLFRWRHGTLQIRKILPGIIAGCLSAAIFSYISYRIDPNIVKKLFGCLLLFTGIRELLYRPRKAR